MKKLVKCITGAVLAVCMVTTGMPGLGLLSQTAQAAADSMPQIDISTDISFTQFYAWAVNKHSPVLLDSLNTWLKHFKQSEKYKEIYQRYYGEGR